MKYKTIFNSLSLFFLCYTINAQVNLDYFFSTSWTELHSEVPLDQIILRESKKEDGIKFEMDSIIYKKRYYSRSCGVLKSHNNLTEVWSFDTIKKQIRISFYLSLLIEKDSLPIYSSIYDILVVRKDYAKLQLVKEYFNENLE